MQARTARGLSSVIMAMGLWAAWIPSAAVAQTDTAFTYQGKLGFQGQPYTGVADYRFSLWTAAEDGMQIGGIVNAPAVDVSGGLFTVELDFGASAFTARRWLQIEVRTPAWDGTGSEPPFAVLDPRQAVTRSPYSIQTRGIFVNEAGDKVGIGTKTPDAALTVARGTGTTEVARFTDPTAVSQLRISATSNRGEVQSWNGSSQVASSLLLNPAGGTVGVGTTNPIASVDVAGGVRTQGGPPGAVGTNDNGYAFSSPGDDDSGLFSLADGQVSIFLDAVERFRFTSAGLRFTDGSAINRNQIVGSRTGVTVDFGSIPGGGRAALYAPLAGAQPGDIIIFSTTADVPYPFLLFNAHCQSANQYRILIHNLGSTAADPAPITYSVLAIRP